MVPLARRNDPTAVERSGDPPCDSHITEDPQALLLERLRESVVSLTPSQFAGGIQCPGSGQRVSLRAWQRQQLHQPLSPLSQVAADIPERAQRSRQPQAGFNLVVVL